MTKKKATEDQFNELHNLVTKEFLSRIKSGEATTQDLKAACDWLKTNDISGVAYDGNPLSKLANVMPEVDPELVQSRLCLLYTSPSPRDLSTSRMPSSA